MYKGIIIFGPMGAGKDALGDAVIQSLGNAVKVKLGKYIRELGDLYDGVRQDYQAIGQALREAVDIDVWNIVLANHLKNNYIGFIPVICDGRQTNEFDYWRNRGYLTVGIHAPLPTRLQRLHHRDGYEPPRHAVVHDTELQAQFVATQLCDCQIDNHTHDIKDIDIMASYIVDKFYKGE